MDRDERLRLMNEGQRAFNRGEFYEAHEFWEEVWNEIDDPERQWVQGMIQIATGLHKLTRDRPDVCRTLLVKALAKLEGASELDGYDLPRLREDAVIGDILIYAGSDLLCYRAEGPRGLLEAQRAHWDPLLAWAKSALDAPLVLAEGVVHVAQPQASLDRLRDALKTHDPFGLAALHVMTGLTGSALLALAVALGRMTPDEAWKAAHVDEDWQMAQWGEDAEAASRRRARRRDFDAAAHALALLKA